MAAGFPAKTSFTDGSVLPASDLNDLGGTINKVYNAGTYPNQLSYRSSSDSILRPIPWGVATGKINYASNINPGGVASVTVTFATPARFTQNPIVTATAEVTGSTNVYASCSTDSVTTSGFTARLYNVASGNDRIITNTYVHYHAIQMTGTDASNNG
jgi:hypothetical protein